MRELNNLGGITSSISRTLYSSSSGLGTSGTAGSSSAAWRQLWFIFVLLLGRALLVLENLPRRSRLWWVEWCSTTGSATIMSAAGGEAGTRGRPWRLLASTPVMEPMEEARRRERGGEQDLMGQIGEKGAVKGRDVGVDW